MMAIMKNSFDEAGVLRYADKCVTIRVIQKIISKSTGSDDYTVKYKVRAEHGNGKIREVLIDDFEKINLFKNLGIPDCSLTSQIRKQIVTKLQMDSCDAEEVIEVSTHTGLQFFSGRPLYVSGNHVLWYGQEDRNINTITTDVYGDIIEMNQQELMDNCQKYIQLIPGVSEVLFYGALFSVIKPFLWQLNIPLVLITVLIAPPGHLKTTLSKLFFLWYKDESRQKCLIDSRVRINEILSDIDRLRGRIILLTIFIIPALQT